MEGMENDITVILTVWKRNHLKEQLDALLQQTLKPTCIWIQQTHKNVDVDSIIEEFKSEVKYTYLSQNKGVFGRFESVKEGVNTPYAFIMDDDIIPGRGFLETSINLSKQANAIVSPAGRIIPRNMDYFEIKFTKEYLFNHYIGDGMLYPFNYCKQDTCVDYGTNAWLFRTEWLDYFFSYPFITRESGEDIHLSAACKLLGKIETYVPKQTTTYNCGNLKRAYSFDETALHKQDGFESIRNTIISNFRGLGWF